MLRGWLRVRSGARGAIGPLDRFQMEEMIDPRDTRRWVCEWIENAYRIVSQPGLRRARCNSGRDSESAEDQKSTGFGFSFFFA